MIRKEITMEKKEFEYIEYYPIGSIILVKGNIRKLMIIARGAMAQLDGEMHFFDYAGVLYPDGLVSDKLIYFNHRDISKIVFKGFADEDEKMMKDNINSWFESSTIKRGNPYDLNMKYMKQSQNK